MGQPVYNRYIPTLTIEEVWPLTQRFRIANEDFLQEVTFSVMKSETWVCLFDWQRPMLVPLGGREAGILCSTQELPRTCTLTSKSGAVSA
jgi:hypothetical protein